MPNNVDSSTSNFYCLQYQLQQSTFANLQCQQQENPTQPASTKNEQVISDTKPYTSPSSDTLKKTSRLIKKIPCEYPECDKAFPSKSRLKEHHRSHTGEKPYKCGVCDNSFTNSSNLKVHRRIHTGEKPYTCNVCHRGFNQHNGLTTHRRIHTREKPYKCTICNTYFTQLGGLNRHQLIHQEKKPNKCTICDKVFDRIDKLNRHFKKIHIQNNLIDNQIREFIKNCNDNKKSILDSSYNSIFEQCQDKSISIEETLVNLFHSLTKKYISNDDAQNVTKNLVSIIIQLPPQFKSTDCLDIRKKAKITTYTELVFILKSHTVDEFLEKYLKIETLQSGDTQHLSTKKRTGSNSLNDDETTPIKKIKQTDELKT